MLAIYIVVFVIMPVLVGFAVYFGHKWRSTLKEAWDEAEKMSREARLKESLKDTLRQAEIRRLEMENTAYSVFNEIQRCNQYAPYTILSEQCSKSAFDERERHYQQSCMNDADIRRAYERCQYQGCMQYKPEQNNSVIDIGVAEVEREEPKELPDSCGHTERVEKRRQE